MSMKRTSIGITVLVLLSGFLLSCGTKQSTPAVSPLATPAQTVSPTESPAANLPDLPQDMLVPFSLEKPLHVGDTHVRGSGPPGVPIVIANVTLMGEPLVYGKIGEDGQFDFELPAPLEANYRIGLMLGDLTGTPWTIETFRNPLFNGEGAQTVPNVGFFYDTSLVVP